MEIAKMGANEYKFHVHTVGVQSASAQDGVVLNRILQRIQITYDNLLNLNSI